jgi:tetratricopeptide (TPR) repeat protein
MERQSLIVKRENHSDYEIPLNALGCLYTNLGRYNEAEEALVKKLEITRRIKGSDAGYEWFTANLAKVYRYQGRYKEAEDLYKKTLEMVGCNPNQRVRPNITLALAGVYRDQGRYAEAEELYRSVMERQTEVYGEGSTVGTMVGLARAYTDQGLCDKANELFAKIDEISGISANRESQNLSYIDTLAVLRTKQGRFPEAKDLFERALEIRKQKFNRWADDHPGTLKTKNDLALLYIKQGNYEKAEPLLVKAVEGRFLKLGDKHPHTQESIKNIIDLYEAWNKPERANEWRAKLPEKETADE